MKTFALAALFLLSTHGIPAQSTVKPSDPDIKGSNLHWSGPNRFVIENYTLRQAIALAYNLPPRMVPGGPAWVNSVRYDMGFEVPSGAALEQVGPSLQALLADRFRLQTHHEQTMMPVYNLVLGQSELKLKPSADAKHPKQVSLFIQGPPSARAVPGRNATMAEFAGFMQRAILDRPVVDKTGLAGRYNFDLEWAAAAAAQTEAGPDIFAAVMQLGLRLEQAESLVDTVVIDYAEQPALN